MGMPCGWEDPLLYGCPGHCHGACYAERDPCTCAAFASHRVPSHPSTPEVVVCGRVCAHMQRLEPESAVLQGVLKGRECTVGGTHTRTMAVKCPTALPGCPRAQPSVKPVSPPVHQRNEAGAAHMLLSARCVGRPSIQIWDICRPITLSASETDTDLRNRELQSTRNS